MKLSYVIPVYNVEKYLAQCLDSVLAQTFDSYEIILVDDASPDSCPQICDSYAERYPDTVKVIHQKNQGPAAARNAGLRKACGDYIYFFDSDDYFGDDLIAEIYEKAVELNLDVLQNSFISCNEKDGSFENKKSAFEVGRVYTHKEMIEKICFSTTERSTLFAWRNLYKRSFLLNNGVFFEEKLRMVEDPPFNLLAFLKAERFAAVDMPNYVYRIRDDSLQRKKYVKDYDLIMNFQWKLKLKYFSENSDNNPRFYRDIADFTVKTNLFILLGNVYNNDIKKKYSLLKRIGESEMMRKSFSDYDIAEYKSKSLDWWAAWLIKRRMYFAAHIICKKILYR